MKRFIVLIAALLSVQTLRAQPWKEFHYQTGDLLFQDLDCGPLCEAIEAVTPGINNRHFSHAGLVYATGDSVYVIEAIGKDVHVTSLNIFLSRQTDSAGRPKIMVGRLKEAYRKLSTPAVIFALKQIGKPYDDAFIYDNGKYYCSELIYDAYKEANQGIPFFNLYPMSFKDPETKRTYPAWKKYYKEIGMDVPEGRQGCNPGSIAINNNVDIVASFY